MHVEFVDIHACDMCNKSQPSPWEDVDLLRQEAAQTLLQAAQDGTLEEVLKKKNQSGQAWDGQLGMEKKTSKSHKRICENGLVK